MPSYHKTEIKRIVLTNGTNPYNISIADAHTALRAAGFTDRDIWDISATAAFYNMTNRMASAIDMMPNPAYHAQAR